MIYNRINSKLVTCILQAPHAFESYDIALACCYISDVIIPKNDSMLTVLEVDLQRNASQYIADLEAVLISRHNRKFIEISTNKTD